MRHLIQACLATAWLAAPALAQWLPSPASPTADDPLGSWRATVGAPPTRADRWELRPRSTGSSGQDPREPWGAEDPEAALRLPEPMVFDLVRPLGARAGELEANVLGLLPLKREQVRSNGQGDPLGIVPESRNQRRVEWAPELEYAPFDGFALEFELPFEGDELEAYKFAAQYTLGVDRESGYQHGLQGILQYNDGPESWTGTLLYLGGQRLSRSWSALAMLGGRSEFGGGATDPRHEFLFNLSVFYDIGYHMSLGFETNSALASGGQRSFLLMPQLHWEVSNRCMLQIGCGVRVDEDAYLPELGARFVVTF